MLDRIHYSAYSLNQLAALAEEIIAVLRSAHQDEMMINGCIARVEHALERAIDSTDNSDEANDKYLNEADHLRDVCYRSLRDHIQAGLGRETNPPYQQACEKLWQVFKSNNTLLASLPFEEETVALRHLFADLEKLPTEISTAHATNWLKELIKANEDFDTAMGIYKNEPNSKEVLSGQEAKASLKDELKILVSTINSLWAFDRPAGIKSTVDDMNKILKETNATLL